MEEVGTSEYGLTPTVTLDVWRLPAGSVPRAALSSLLLPRRLRSRAEPALFARLLGTGDDTFVPSGAELRRWALLTVWPTTVAIRPVEPAWARGCVSSWHATLAPLASRGTWAGTAPFVPASRAVAAQWDGPVLSVTHARLRPRSIRRFLRSVPDVARTLSGQPGLVAAFGMGELPIGVQGTVSLWRDAAAVREFAWRTHSHRAVVRRTPSEGWYSEEIFARFAVLARTGDPDTLRPTRRLGQRPRSESVPT